MGFKLLKRTLMASACLLMISSATAAPKKKAPKAASNKAVYVSANNNTILKLNTAGEVVWRLPAGGVPHDLSYLPNGNILFACGTHVREVTPDKKVVFEYRPENQHGGGVYSCQRLPNGNTVVGENSTCRVLEFDKNGKQIFELQCQTNAKNKHHKMRVARKLRNGNFLVCHSGENTVREYDKKGKIVWEFKAKALCFQAERLPNGNTLISSLGQLTEYKPDNSIAWEFKTTDIPGKTIRNITGFKLLKNGNLLMGCYGAYRGGDGTGMLEITRKKDLVWSIHDKSVSTSMMAIDKIQPPSKKKKRRR